MAPSRPSVAGSSNAARDHGSRLGEIQRACRRGRFPRQPFPPRGTGPYCPTSRCPTSRLASRSLRRSACTPRLIPVRSALVERRSPLPTVDELAGIAEIAREEPHEIPGGRQATDQEESTPGDRKGEREVGRHRVPLDERRHGCHEILVPRPSQRRGAVASDARNRPIASTTPQSR